MDLEKIKGIGTELVRTRQQMEKLKGEYDRLSEMLFNAMDGPGREPEGWSENFTLRQDGKLWAVVLDYEGPDDVVEQPACLDVTVTQLREL